MHRNQKRESDYIRTVQHHWTTSCQTFPRNPKLLHHHKLVRTGFTSSIVQALITVNRKWERSGRKRDLAGSGANAEKWEPVLVRISSIHITLSNTDLVCIIIRVNASSSVIAHCIIWIASSTTTEKKKKTKKNMAGGVASLWTTNHLELAFSTDCRVAYVHPCAPCPKVHFTSLSYFWSILGWVCLGAVLWFCQKK